MTVKTKEILNFKTINTEENISILNNIRSIFVALTDLTTVYNYNDYKFAIYILDNKNNLTLIAYLLVEENINLGFVLKDVELDELVEFNLSANPIIKNEANKIISVELELDLEEDMLEKIHNQEYKTKTINFNLSELGVNLLKSKTLLKAAFELKTIIYDGHLLIVDNDNKSLGTSLMKLDKSISLTNLTRYKVLEIKQTEEHILNNEYEAKLIVFYL